MKIIDRKTGKRIVDPSKKKINKLLKELDPIQRNALKGGELEEHSPMDPPEAYDSSLVVEGVKYEDMHPLLQGFMDEHKVSIEKLEQFEKTLIEFKKNNFTITREANEIFSTFFQFFDDNIMEHNQREEKRFFPLLHQKLIESGEKGEGENPQTAVDMMEDDHIKFIQLGSLTFNILGLATRLPDDHSRALAFDVAYNNGMELIELLRLHIYREDNILFPLAHQLISTEEFVELTK